MEGAFDWFRKARFGLMVHWGLYSLLGGEWRGQRMDYIGEWIQSRFRIPGAEYGALAGQMNPTEFDADAWVRLAKTAGMGYIVVTAKHHEGFAMYRSRVDRFNIVDATPFGRDPIEELAGACARHGLRLGLYYSQELDWHEPDGGGYTRGHTNYGMSWTNDWDYPDNEHKDFSRCFEGKILPQVEELLTQYGDLGLIWFDTPGVITPEQSRTLYDLVKRHQPGCMVNSRIGNGLGDYTSLGDNQMPGAAGRRGMLYETPATLNDTWGYKSFDDNWKTPEEVVGLLARLASRDTNYLLNVGPDGLGRIPQAAQDTLADVGRWMERNHEAVQGNEPSPFPMDMPAGPVTKKGNKLYFILSAPRPGGSFKLNGVGGQALSSHLLKDAYMPLTQIQHPLRGLEGVSRLGVMLPGNVRRNDVLEVAFMGEPMVPRLPVEQPSGALELRAASAERMGDVEIDRGGALSGWKEKTALLGWRFFVVRDGAFEVSMRFVGSHLERPATGFRVTVSVDGEEVSAQVLRARSVDTPENRYYILDEASLCRIELEEGVHDLSIHLTEDAQEPVALQCLRITRLA